jgi:3,4-dihydroxy 2-butanone 4-phosphate synthase/GTP cyclohydrolase II
VETDVLDALAHGRPALLVDAEHGDKGGLVVLPAALAEPRWAAWMVRRTSGFLCAPLPAARADDLGLPPMVAAGADSSCSVHSISVDAASGVTTGISATDRARTARVLADERSRPSDLTRAGHVVPVRVSPHGMPERRDYAQAAIEICAMAGLPPVALVAGLMGDNGATAGLSATLAVGTGHDLPVVDVDAVDAHRLFHGDGEHPRVDRRDTTLLDTDHGRFAMTTYLDNAIGVEHIVLRAAKPAGRSVPTAVHRECVTSAAFAATGCRCQHRLHDALDTIAEQGGLVIYLRASSDASQRCDAAAAAAILRDQGRDTVHLLPSDINADDLSTIAYVILTITGVAFGMASDRIGRNPVRVFSCVFLAAVAIPSLLMSTSDSLVLAIVAPVLFAIPVAGTSVSMYPILMEMFPASVRYSAGSISYNLSYVIFGSSTPFVVGGLIAATLAPLIAGIYVLVIAVVGAIVGLVLPETRE